MKSRIYYLRGNVISLLLSVLCGPFLELLDVVKTLASVIPYLVFITVLKFAVVQVGKITILGTNDGIVIILVEEQSTKAYPARNSSLIESNCIC